MGDIADMMLDGTLDSETGEFIDGDSPGYPRSMNHRNNPVNGVTKWLTKQGLPVDQHMKVIVDFCLPTNNRAANSSKKELCDYIQTCFHKFCSYYYSWKKIN